MSYLQSYIQGHMAPVFLTVPFEQAFEQILALRAFPDYYQALRRNYHAQESLQYECAINDARSYLARVRPEPIAFIPPCTSLGKQHQLPDDLLALAHVLAETYGMGTLETAFMVLAMISSAAWGSYEIRVNAAWKIATSGFYILAKPSGRKKSALINTLSLPFNAFAKEKQNIFWENHSSFQKDCLKRTISHSTKQAEKELSSFLHALKSDEINDALKKIEHSVCQAKALLATPDTPPEPFLSRPSMAHAIRFMKAHGGHCTIIGAENPFSAICLRKADVKNATNLLDMNDFATLNYSGRGGKIIHIQNPTLSIAAAMQDSVLQEFYDKKHLHDNGFLNRLVVCLGIESNYTLNVDGSGLSSHTGAGSPYFQLISSMLRKFHRHGKNKSIIAVGLTDAAQAVIKNYQQSPKEYYTQNFQPYLSRNPEVALKFAICVHLWNAKGSATSINAEEAQAGVSMAKSLTPHAFYLFSKEMRTLKVLANRVVGFLAKRNTSGPFRVSITEILQGLGGKMDKNTLLPAIELLERHKYLVVFHRNDRPIECAVNPNIHRFNLLH